MLERPSVILAIHLVIALVLMFTADVSLGYWTMQFPQELRPAATWITRRGEGIEFLVVSGIILLLGIFVPTGSWRRSSIVRAEAAVLAAGFAFFSVVGGGLVDLLLKNVIGRARPVLFETYGHLHFKLFAFSSTFASFPSGHSSTAGAMAMSLCLLFPRFRSVFIAMGVLICLSRLALHAHWASDIVMGWAVGIAFSYWLAHFLARRGILFGYDPDGFLRRQRSVEAIRHGSQIEA
jgi:membrane-associated phospholipid phosphatase